MTLLDRPGTVAAPERPRRSRSLRRIASTAVLVALVALAAYATVVPLLIQRSGVTLVTITSGSMTPLFPVGGTIGIRQAPDPTALQPGQIITFRALGNGQVITHRIVERVDRPSLGQVHYQTKGDANRSADPNLVPASTIIGVADDVLPAWQRLAVSLQTPLGRLLVYGSLFLAVALGEVGELVRSARRRDRDTDEAPDVPAADEVTA